jgi:hypothetical protein
VALQHDALTASAQMLPLEVYEDGRLDPSGLHLANAGIASMKTNPCSSIGKIILPALCSESRLEYHCSSESCEKNEKHMPHS